MRQYRCSACGFQTFHLPKLCPSCLNKEWFVENVMFLEFDNDDGSSICPHCNGTGRINQDLVEYRFFDHEED